MTERQRQLVRESFDAVKADAGPLALLFYGRLFSLDPTLRPLFKVDMREQSRKLMDMFTVLVSSLDRLEELRPELRELGAKHAGYGVRVEHYETLRGALLWSLGQALEKDFDGETREAWGVLIGEINEEMKRGATAGA
ncbi:MAG: globin domain-containing protein [Bryobacteraceae bacterium]|nr:globin domain-containing protein [Bryobacteraceae bacterium]